jgi:hypothetical protein
MATLIDAFLFRRYIYTVVLLPIVLGVYMGYHFTAINLAPGETGLAAISMVRDGTIADPYLIPTGPTAHVSPIQVGVLAAIYEVFGPNSPVARTVMSILSVAMYAAATVGVLRFCRKMRLGAGSICTALVLTCALPTHLFMATIQLRQWDQPFAAVILMASLLITADPRLEFRPRFQPERLLALLVGLSATMTPMATPTLLVALVYSMWVRAGIRDWRCVLQASFIIAIFIVPWGLRNHAELGKFILTRSNFGLELAVGNHDGATGRSSDELHIHPHESLAAAQRVAQIGEVPFMAEMSDRAKRWIAEHPFAFIKLTLTRLRLLVLPDGSILPWDPIFGHEWLALLIGALAVLRLAALLLILALRARPMLWFGHCYLPLAPYLITHVNYRYEYPVFFTSVCMVCTGIALCLQLRTRNPFGSNGASTFPSIAPTPIHPSPPAKNLVPTFIGP